MKKKDPSSSPKPRRSSQRKSAAAPRKRAAKPKAAANQAEAAAALFAPRLDYPQEGERIISPEYTLRVDAPHDGLSIEVSIDRGDWQACRTAVGYWWFDWAGFGPGEHSIHARAVASSGDFAVSPERRCVVEP